MGGVNQGFLMILSSILIIVLNYYIHFLSEGQSRFCGGTLKACMKDSSCVYYVQQLLRISTGGLNHPLNLKITNLNSLFIYLDKYIGHISKGETRKVHDFSFPGKGFSRAYHELKNLIILTESGSCPKLERQSLKQSLLRAVPNFF